MRFLHSTRRTLGLTWQHGSFFNNMSELSGCWKEAVCKKKRKLACLKLDCLHGDTECCMKHQLVFPKWLLYWSSSHVFCIKDERPHTQIKGSNDWGEVPNYSLANQRIKQFGWSCILLAHMLWMFLVVVSWAYLFLAPITSVVILCLLMSSKSAGATSCLSIIRIVAWT